ncbi:MAG: signal peptide peptidase SppA [Nanoarchaeota archaeon]
MFADSGIPSPKADNVAVIDVSGLITSHESSDFTAPAQATSSQIIEFIERAEQDPSVAAIMFRIDSGGGTPVATEEIASAIERTDKPTLSVIRETGASGAYWIASATDTIFANRMSIVGSIGVSGSQIGLEGFMERYNITYRQLVSAEYKDIGSPFREMTEEEKEHIEEQLDEIHKFFADTVASNRNLSQEEKDEIATGMFWTGSKAKELDLVDQLGGQQEAIAYIEDKLDVEVGVVEYKKEPSFGDLFFGIFSEASYYLGKGLGSSMLQNEYNKAHEKFFI